MAALTGIKAEERQVASVLRFSPSALYLPHLALSLSKWGHWGHIDHSLLIKRSTGSLCATQHACCRASKALSTLDTVSRVRLDFLCRHPTSIQVHESLQRHNCTVYQMTVKNGGIVLSALGSNSSPRKKPGTWAAARPTAIRGSGHLFPNFL